MPGPESRGPAEAVSSLLLVPLVTLAYLLSAALGLLVAIPPSYVSPVFPAAGLALACALHFGPRALVGAWLGSALVSLALNRSSLLSASAVVVTLCSATGAAAQAWAGAWAVRRWQGASWQKLERQQDVFRFLLLGGVLVGWVSSSLAVTGLALTGIVEPAALPFTWWTWYAGDVLGVLIFTPLTLCLLNSRDRLWLARRRSTLLPTLVAVCLAMAAFVGAAQWERQRREDRLRADGTALAGHIADRLITHREVLQSLRNFVEVTPQFDFAQFERFTYVSLRDHPDISALSFNDLVSRAQRPAFEQKMSRLSPLGPFQITQRDPQKRLVRALDRPEYVAVRYIVPLDKSKPAVGFDINSEPIRRDAINRARASGNMAVTAPVQLVQDQKKRVGLLELLPVAGPSPGPAGSRPGALQGFAVAVVKVDEMIAIATRGHLPPGLSFTLTDPNAPAPQQLLYHRDGGLEHTPLRKGTPTWRTRLRIGDRDWELTVHNADRFLGQSRPWTALVVAVVGLVFATLLQVLMLGMTGQTATIEQQKEALEEAKHEADGARDQLQATLDAIPDLLFELDDEGNCLRVISARETPLQPSKQALLGKNLHDVLPPDARSSVLEALAAAKRWGSDYGRVVGYSGSGGLSWFELSVACKRHGVEGPLRYIVLSRDVTDRCRAEQASKKAARALRLLTDCNVALFRAKDEEWLLREICRLIRESGGYRAAWVRLADEGTAPSFPEAELPREAAVEEPSPLAPRVSDDGAHPAEVGLPLTVGESVLGSLVIRADGADAFRPDELELLNELARNLAFGIQTLRESARRVAAELASVAKSSFLAKMSHEIRTPMNAILGFTYLLLRDAPRPDQTGRLDKMHDAARHLLSLVNDILDLSKIEADKMELEHVGFDLEQTLGSSCGLIAERAAAKGLALLTTIDDDVPLHLVGDPLRLGQILLNYLTNAVKFTSKGEVALHVGVETRTDEGVLLRFSVRDTGVGLTEEQKSKLFQTFHQAETSTTRRYGGTGLGLTISKHLAELMGGGVGVESEPGVGTTFWFTALLAVDAEPAPALPRAGVHCPRPTPDLTPVAGARILLVEDNPLNQEIASELLREGGFTVDTAGDGAAAVELATANDYDLVLMDVQMPVLDGISATQQIRQLPGRRLVPIVAMTANTMAGDRERYLAAGMNDFIAKPIEPSDLWDALLRWVEPQSTRPPGAPAAGPPVGEPSPEIELPEVPGLDTALGLHRVLGKKPLYLSLLRGFVDRHAADGGAVRRAVDGGAWATARRLAHTTRGVAGNLGASRLQEAAAALESALAATGPRGPVDPLLRQFETSLGELVGHLSAKLPAVVPKGGADTRPPGQPTDLSPPSSAQTRGPRLRVLVTDDSESSRLVLGSLLEEFGHEAHVAASGHACLEALRRADFDLVLLDCQMPEMDGYEVVRLLRDPAEGARNPAVPVVAVTAGTTAAEREQCAEAGMNDYLEKPVEPAALARILERWCDAAGDASGVLPPAGLHDASEVFDEGQMLRLMMNNRKLASVVVRGFLGNLPRQLANLETVFLHEDRQTLRREAHALKGAAATVGAVALRALALQLEEWCAEEKDLGHVPSLLSALEDQSRIFEQTVARLGWSGPTDRGESS